MALKFNIIGILKRNFEVFKRIKHKFNAKKVKVGQEKYDSKLEYAYKLHLDKLIKNGAVLFYLKQTPIHLPGGTKYICDFLVFYTTGEVKFIDVKGMETDVFKIKKREIEAIYPFEIEIIKKGDF